MCSSSNVYVYSQHGVDILGVIELRPYLLDVYGLWVMSEYVIVCGLLVLAAKQFLCM